MRSLSLRLIECPSSASRTPSPARSCSVVQELNVGQHECQPPDELLAAAFLVRGEAQLALNVLHHAPGTDARETPLRALLATAHFQFGQRDAARRLAAAGLLDEPLEAFPHSLAGFLASMRRRLLGDR